MPKGRYVCSFCGELFRGPSRRLYCDECQVVLGPSKRHEPSGAAGAIALSAEIAGDVFAVTGTGAAVHTKAVAIKKFRPNRSIPKTTEQFPARPATSKSHARVTDWSLWERIQRASHLWQANRHERTGSSRDIYVSLVVSFSADEIQSLAKSPLHLGICLGHLQHELPNEVSKHLSHGRYWIWTIRRSRP